MNDDSTLREKAREVIQAGQLPNRHPDRTWGGPGIGADCTICSAPIRRNEIEIEIEFIREDDDPGPTTYHLHSRCFAIWELERHNLELARGIISPSDQTPSATRPSMGGLSEPN